MCDRLIYDLFDYVSLFFYEHNSFGYYLVVLGSHSLGFSRFPLDT